MNTDKHSSKLPCSSTRRFCYSSSSRSGFTSIRSARASVPVDNAFDIMRHSVEIGLLALAMMTQSCSRVELICQSGHCSGYAQYCSANSTWRDAGMPIPLAAACTIGVGALAGGLNAVLITRLRCRHSSSRWGLLALSRAGRGHHARREHVLISPRRFLFPGQERWLGAFRRKRPSSSPLPSASGCWCIVPRLGGRSGQ